MVAGAGGYWRGPGGCSEGYVRERSSAALPGLSWLLMTAMEWTSRTPSPPASRSSSSSTTLTPGSLAPPRPASPSPGRGSHNGFWGPQQPLASIVSIAALQLRQFGCSRAASAGQLHHLRVLVLDPTL